MSTPTINKISLAVVSSGDRDKVDFTTTEENTAVAILVHVGTLAEIIKDHAKSNLISEEIQAAVQESLDGGASKFPQIVSEAYRTIEKGHFSYEEEGDVKYETALDATNWPRKRCYAALNGMLRRVAVREKVLTKEQADQLFPSYQAKKVVRRA